ncbi:MAG: murein L,D-transpeptidase catalytic domain family protein [Bdellovibrionaceae bacterium]|nr:murein L,D-transpeptidase catalytic domain family protein [Pseudobdellovibrionaceae bacterium]
MRFLFLSLLLIPFTSWAETCPQIRMKPGENPRLYQHLSVPKNCTAESVFTCPNGDIIRTQYASADRLQIGARCFVKGDPEYARLRPSGRETLTPTEQSRQQTNGSLGQATPANGGQETPRRRGANDLNAAEIANLKKKAIAAGVPEVIFDRALKNFLEMKRQGKTDRHCFMAADMTTPGGHGKLWQICALPVTKITEMPTNYGSGLGDNCKDHVYRNTSSECAIYFGNRPGYCLTAGGNYVTQNVTRQRGTERPFVELLGLDAGENDNAGPRGVGIHQTTFSNGRSYIGQTDRSRYSNGCITIPASGVTVDPLSLSAQSEEGAMALYVYPSKQDVLDMRNKGTAAYWHQGCAKQERRPAWIGADANDAPTQEEESQRELADWLNMKPTDARR